MRLSPHRILWVSALLFSVAAAQPIDTPDVLAKPAAEVERRLPDSHPAQYFTYAGRAWQEGRRDDAVFWLYVAQLRYRFHLAAHPSTDPSGDPALFGSLLATIGEPINRYAGEDIPNWRKQIARALQWDQATPNGFTSKKEFAKAWQQTRSGLENMSSALAQNAEALKKQREAMLLRESQRPALKTPPAGARPPAPPARPPKILMPADWPALESRTTAAMIVGSYEGGVSSPFARAFFDDVQGKVSLATTFELAAPDEQHLRIRAVRGGRVLRERVLDIQQTDAAVVFVETAPDREAGLQLGAVRRRLTLRKNIAGDLVIQREIFVAPMSESPESDPAKYTFWNRAPRELPVDTAANK